ncbi:phosphatidate cytidylyltransferase [Thermoclostridium stercorarium]|uniref:phosphatidate cytidylyltransferase n=1 Tax=Thermoclostridium stercorarium TaxID=1510 RepID=UPI000558746B|nr:phosphatidate cytidylyltransferase [Thermoclostridium stercorarium]
MRTRIISGTIAAIILFVIMQLPPFMLGVAVFIVSSIALYEFYQCVRRENYNPIRTIGFFTSTVYFLYLIGSAYIDEISGTFLNDLYRTFFRQDIIYLFIYIVIVCLLLQLVFRHRRFNLKDVAVTLLGIAYIPFLISFIFLVRLMENGYELSWLVIIATFSTDIFAYFTGKFFGKRKLVPDISPNKTVAGGIGGIAGSIVCTTLFGILYMNTFSALIIEIYHYMILGVLCGIIAQLGDWAASAIKRNVGIKDFGHIMPGHGGLLDRIDSLLFVAPAVYFYIKFFIF